MNKEIHSFITSELKPGAVSIVIVEDEICLNETIFHNAKLGFPNIIIVSKAAPILNNPSFCDANICWFEVAETSRNFILKTLNEFIERLEGRWIYYCYNAEFLFFPFLEDRMVQDLARFMEEERRGSIFCHVIDLYSLNKEVSANPPATAHLDASGYYAMNRFDNGKPLERQIEVFGGLKWRYAEHVPWARQRIDRVAFFKAAKGLVLDDDFRFNVAEMNTYSCPWHHNVTCAIASFRTSKSLLRNPGSAGAIDNFMWEQSVPFEWHSKQLMELGMMEPGQWF